MSEEEPAWRAELGNMIGNLADLFPEAEGLRAVVSALVNHQIQAAEQRGREAALNSFACGVCGHAVGWIDSPHGGWWAHAAHPSDGHDADGCFPDSEKP